MQANHWVVQIEKNEEGKVCLKFCGYFNIPGKQMAGLIIVFAAAISYIIHYLQ